MLTFDERIDNLEAAMTKISLELSDSFTNGVNNATNDELGAVIDEVWDEIDSLKERYLYLKNQTKLVDNIVNSATRK